MANAPRELSALARYVAPSVHEEGPATIGEATAPLRQADDADLLDTSHMDIDAAIAAAIELVEAHLAKL